MVAVTGAPLARGAGAAIGTDPNANGGSARMLVFTLPAATIRGKVIPHTFSLGFFRERLLILGFDVVADLTWPLGGQLTMNGASFGGSAAPWPVIPPVVDDGNAIEFPESCGFLTVDVGDDLSLALSGETAAGVSGGQITITVFAVTVGAPA